MGRVLTLLTMTGARPEAFALCQRWIARQDYVDPVTWIIVDDGVSSSPVDFALFDSLQIDFTIVRPRPYWRPGMNTQTRNILAGLEHVTRRDRPVVIIEDDDWYAPDWLSTVDREMTPGIEVFGERDAVYYNVARQIRRSCNNPAHASLCATAVRGHGIARLKREAERRQKFVDIELWRGTPEGKKRLVPGGRVVGIKGIPGRDNIGVGKQLTGDRDPSWEQLRHLVGSDWTVYQRFARP